MPFDRDDQLYSGALDLSPTQVQANRYELLSRVVDGLAHEVKNPIHAAVINLELLRRRVADPDSATRLARIDLLEEGITQLHDLIDALFRFLRPSSEDAGWSDLDGAIAAILPMIRAYCRVARVEVGYTVASGMMVGIESSTLQQIVLNLVVNAVDARRAARGKIEIEGAVVGDEVHLWVSDTGPRAPAVNAPGPGATEDADRPGTAGWRLTISRRLAEEAGGRIEIEGPADGTGGARLVLVLRSAVSA
jgi:signal transduction histidine kinase